jgi:hypothetical protein
MVRVPRNAATHLLVLLLALFALVTGCSSAREIVAPPPAPVTTAARTPAPAPPPADLGQLLISAEDIPLPGFLPPVVRPLDEDAVEGVEAFFDSQDGSRQLGQTIVLLPDADAARSAMLGAARLTEQQRTGASSAPAPAGDAGVIITGFQHDGTASTLLLFSVGTASVAMDFRSPAADPVPPAAAIAAGVRQAALLRGKVG